MKKFSAVVTTVFTLAVFSFLSCDLAVDDEGNRKAYVEQTQENNTFIDAITPAAWSDTEAVSLTSTAWWSGTGDSGLTELIAGEYVTYTFKVSADGEDCMVEAYDSASTVYYLSTTSQKTAWTTGQTDALTNIGAQETGVLKAGNIYTATVYYDGSKVTVIYLDWGEDSSSSTQLFTTATTGTVTAPVEAHIVAQYGTFYVITEKGSINKTLSSISVNSDSAQTTYTTNAAFSADNLVVTATYDSGATASVTENLSYSYVLNGETVSLTSGETTLSTTGNYTVTVTYTEGGVTKTATYEISVSDAVVLNSISVDVSNAATVYVKGASFSSENVAVTASYSDGNSKTVTGTFSGYDMSAAGSQTVTVSYTEDGVTKTAEYTIVVHDCSVTDNTVTYNDGATLTNITLYPFDVSSSDIFTVSFNATFASADALPDLYDWSTQVVKTGDNYILTVPNLDPWNNTASASAISGKNGYPTMSGAYLANALAYNSAFTGEKVAVTISFNKTDKSIVYTLGGKAWVVYTASVWDGGIEEFINAFADALTAGTLTFNANSLAYSDLVITKGRASGGSASEIVLSSSSVSDTLDNWAAALKSVSGCVVYSDGSADAVTLSSDGISLAYKNGDDNVEESAVSVGTYTVTAAYGTVSTEIALTVTSNYENTVTGSGTVESPYVLASTLTTTVSEKAALDCATYQSTTTWDSTATYCWDNPLYGLENVEGVTISFLLNNATGASYDSILTFFPNGGTGWGGVAFTENGTAHAQGHGYWDVYLTDNDSNIVSASTWTRVTYVIGAAGGTVTAYVDGVSKGTATLANTVDDTTTNVDTIAYLTGTCDKVAIGVGFCPSWWLAGYVDADTYLSDIKVYSTALTAEQVAAIE
ncbi:bacterial Ig-like domain-containing protein [Treponema sp.]|uniref:bacterial Ig-like domain-containing protein n=1 Tax=Treponema sp. TaxID=166 RepID=UPI003890EA9F